MSYNTLYNIFVFHNGFFSLCDITQERVRITWWMLCNMLYYILVLCNILYYIFVVYIIKHAISMLNNTVVYSILLLL
jgi:hypothetical protein